VADVDVLVVEDAPEYAQLIADVLAAVGHRARVATSVAEATTALQVALPDLLILDLGLPDGDGLDLCSLVRNHSNAYIMVVSGRSERLDAVRGFDLGADDYVLKPFSSREFAARVEAVLRRPRQGGKAGLPRVVGNLHIDVHAREVLLAGERIDLTRLEFDLLDVLSADPKAVLTRRQLLERVWGDNWYGDDHVVDVHIANLRRKLDQPGSPSLIRTVRGIGYSLQS
jgi:DNA-binding response OmpR family regulator